MTTDTPWYQSGNYVIRHGDCIAEMDKLEPESVHAIVTDPPYGLGFMGKEWDALPPGLDFAIAAHRVLKPGGYILAFGGTRTWHRLAVAIEDAGFEIRDSIAWMYGSGFPKSLNVSAAMAQYLEHGPTAADGGPHPDLYTVTRFLRAARDRAGWTNARIDALFDANGMAGHWTSAASQPRCPSVRQWEVLKAELGFDDSIDALVAKLAATERPEDWGADAGDGRGFLTTLAKDYEPGDPVGWGTALKPAFEPIVVGRKRFPGPVAANVLAHGTGAMNIDGARVPGAPTVSRTASVRKAPMAGDEREGKSLGMFAPGATYVPEAHAGGRFPPNVVLDESQAEALGADVARFFPTFRYVPKPGGAERPEVDGTVHPTVKPLALMQWLVRLVTPPGGTVLDPFAGSGTTLEACIREGFSCVTIERDAEYLPLIRARAERDHQQSLFVDLDD